MQLVQASKEVLLEASTEVVEASCGRNSSCPCTWATPGLPGLQTSVRTAVLTINSMEAYYVEVRQSEVHQSFEVSRTIVAFWWKSMQVSMGASTGPMEAVEASV